MNNSSWRMNHISSATITWGTRHHFCRWCHLELLTGKSGYMLCPFPYLRMSQVKSPAGSVVDQVANIWMTFNLFHLCLFNTIKSFIITTSLRCRGPWTSSSPSRLWRPPLNFLTSPVHQVLSLFRAVYITAYDLNIRTLRSDGYYMTDSCLIAHCSPTSQNHYQTAGRLLFNKL